MRTLGELLVAAVITLEATLVAGIVAGCSFLSALVPFALANLGAWRGN